MGEYGCPPAFATLVDYASTAGPMVARLCEAVGYRPDPEQRLILDQVFALTEEGLPAASTVVVIAPRQNLKTAVLKMITLGWFFVTLERSVTWSAHEFGTAKGAFEDPFETGLVQLIENTPMLARRLKSVGRSHGSEGFVMAKPAGAEFKLRARTATGGRGLTADKVILDEGFALRDEQIGALRPTMMARPRSQLVIASSACRERSTVLRDWVKRGRAGGEARFAYLEWCDPRANEGCGSEDCDHARTAVGCALDDLGRLAAANPAFPHRVSEASLRDARRDMSPSEFAIEIMGWHEEPHAAETSDLGVDVWSAAVTSEPVAGRVVLAADVSPSSTWASVVACGGGVLELVDRRRGTRWLPERLAELCRRHDVSEVVIDPSGPIGGVIPDLEAAGVRLRMLSGAESLSACGQLVECVQDGRVRPRASDALVAAVAGARRRRSGDRWRWSRVSSEVDISPLAAATWAVYGWIGSQSADYDLLSSCF